ncbi:MAG: CCA tRNA nucleotidyltransferase [Flavobacteriaceae bacterium]
MKKEILKILKEEPFLTIYKTANDLKIESYLVGGFVRDIFLNINEKKDIDIMVIGSAMELAKNLKKNLNNSKNIQFFKNFGTAMLEWNKFVIEVVGARKESYNHNSRKPIVKIGTLEDDQNRRDFTINSLAISINKQNFGELIDPFNGVRDLKNKIIKTPLNPDKTYSDDPLRMFRAIRFSSQLNFNIETESFESIRKNIDRVNIISKERIVDELNKIILSKKPSIGFLNLDKSGLLKRIIPEITNLKGIEEIEGKSHKENFYHTLEVLDNISMKSKNLWLRWAALLHDVGKPLSKKYNSKTGWTFHGHEFIGSKMVYQIFKRLKLPLNNKMKYVQKLVLLSSRPIIISEDFITDSAVRRLIFDSGDILGDLIKLCEADITTKNPKLFKDYHENFKIVRNKIKALEEKDNLRNFQPPISGQEIMKSFNIGPSREIGIIKEKIKEAIIEGEVKNEYKSTFKLMKKIGEKLGLKFNEK